MTLVFVIAAVAYLGFGLWYARDFGYRFEKNRRKGHSYQGICDACECINCNQCPEDHENRWSPCKEYVPNEMLHWSTRWAVLGAVFGWFLILLAVAFDKVVDFVMDITLDIPNPVKMYRDSDIRFLRPMNKEKV